MNPTTKLLSTPTTMLAEATTTTPVPRTLVMLGLLAIGLWLLVSGGGHGGGGGSGGKGRSRRGGSGPLTLVVIGLLIGATPTGSAMIYKAVAAFSGAVNTLSGLFH